MSGTQPDGGAQPGEVLTRGFLFCDLRGYTAYAEAHGDRAAAELLDSYRAIVRAAIARTGGGEIRTEGDGFYVVFPSASSAVRCGLAIIAGAADAAAGARGVPIPAAVGIHAGESVERPDGYVGSAVNTAARICAEAAAGEVLVSETVRSLVRTSLEVRFSSRGRRQLKGLREPVALYAVAPAGPTAARPTSRPQIRAGRSALGAGALVLAAIVVAGLVVLRGPSPGPSGSSGPSPTAAPGGFASGGSSPSAPASASAVASAIGGGPAGVIAFISSQSVGSSSGTGTGDRGQIYTLDLGTGQRSPPLTPIGQAICSMALAPDRTRLVYTAGRPCTGSDAETAGPPTVVDLRTGASHPWPGTWKADPGGPSQALITKSGPVSLVVQPHALAWAGDGSLLAYGEAGPDTGVGGHPTAQGIYAVAADGASARLLVPLTLSVSNPDLNFSGRADEIAWDSRIAVASDGRSLAYALPARSFTTQLPLFGLVYTSDIWATDLQGTAPAQVTDGVKYAVDPTWSPDGARIAFSGTQEDGGVSDIWVVDTQGSGLGRLTDDAATDDHPSWSPDGAWIAWSKAVNLQRQLWVMRSDGTDPHLLLAGSTGEGLDDPLWAPMPPG
ncbi:MAG: adenylate/guanylate cyclase domain-containing protein [Candidatus Limnocylindrales bacterium]